MGINLFDTSPGYGDGRSEELLGQALKELPRDQVVVSTKIPLAGGHSDVVRVMKPHEIAPAVEASLLRLGLETVDVLLMAVAGPQYYDPVMDDHLPVLQKLKQQGKIRFLGSSEQTRSDGAHQWLQRILPTGVIEVAMMGHNMLNQSAQRTVLPLCREQDIGVLNVFTVRNLFWNPSRLREVIAALKARGLLAADAVSDDDPLGWLLTDGDAESLVEAAYRYAVYTEGVTTVMCGTIEVGELEENVRTITKGPLSADKVARLKAEFGHLAEAIGN
jgi:aryl-alcohol dehydrogenase-like predicted oxidoreductase